MRILFLILSTMMLTVNASAQSAIVINEVMQSNIDYLMVENDFPDSWVELYNNSPSSVNVGGWKIGVKEDIAKCYTLPSRTIPAYGYLVIYCDKENTGMHTDFRVDSGKGSIYLYDQQDMLADMVTLAKMPAPNVAYGRTSDGADEWYYEFQPTAGAANQGGGAANVLPQPIFNMTGGVLTSAPTDMLEITMPDGCPSDCKICFTLDGTEPTATSTRGPRVLLPVTKTMVVRAKIISTTGTAVPSRSVTQSFIFHPRTVTMPVVSLVTDNAYFYDTKTGILVSNINNGKPNYMQKWRRPLNVEYFTADGVQVFNQLGETAVSGVSTRELPQKSLKIYANKRFDVKNYAWNDAVAGADGAFWSDKPQVRSVKSFVLRSGGNNSMSSRINDAVVQTLFGTHVSNIDWQAYQPVIVYLNGRYIGEFGMRERSDEDYVESNYNGLEDVELADETSYQQPEEGSLFATFHSSYHSKSSNYAMLEEQMDMENFINALACEMYGMNTDFPTNNVSMWRSLPYLEGEKQKAERTATQRWRWIVKDVDRFGMSLPLYPRSFDMFTYMFRPDALMYGGMQHFDLYKKLDSFSDFRKRFAQTLCVYLADFLKPQVVTGVIDRMADQVRPEISATMSVYNGKTSDFNSGITSLKNTAEQRPDYLYSQMENYYNFGKLLPMTIYASDHEVTICDIPLTTGVFSGKYLSQLPLTLSSGSDYKTWTMTATHSDNTVTTVEFPTPEVSVTLSKYMKSSADIIAVEWTIVDNTDTGISNACLKNITPERITDAPVYDIYGIRHTRPFKGISIIGGRKVVR